MEKTLIKLSDEIADLCEIMDKFFDCVNVRSDFEHIKKKKPFLAPNEHTSDSRLGWFENEFLQYFHNWEDSEIMLKNLKQIGTK